MNRQRGFSLSDLVIVILIVSIAFALSMRDGPELRDGVVEVQKVNCPSVVPGEDEETDCILRVTTKDPGRLTSTTHILLLKEGEELVPDEEG